MRAEAEEFKRRQAHTERERSEHLKVSLLVFVGLCPAVPCAGGGGGRVGGARRGDPPAQRRGLLGGDLGPAVGARCKRHLQMRLCAVERTPPLPVSFQG